MSFSRRATIIVALLAPALAQGQDKAGPAAGPPRAKTAAELAQGEQLFTRECAVCHGPGGEGGRGPTLAVPRLVRAADWESLTKVISGGVEGTEMPGAHLDRRELGQVASWVLKLGRRPPQKVPGDTQRGEQLYAGKGGCALCHAVQGRGGSLGPDLSDIGLRRGASHLRRALLDPEADLPRSTSAYRGDVNLVQNFLSVRAVTAAGREVSGVRLNEDTFSIQIRDVAGDVHSFFKSELHQLDKEWGRSPMPSYRDALAPEELDDLVAYLVGLRGTP
jgi:cytochrome c oxidase cbb3-type subunit 3